MFFIGLISLKALNSRIAPFGLVSGTSKINSIKVILSELLVINVLEHFELQLSKKTVYALC